MPGYFNEMHISFYIFQTKEALLWHRNMCLSSLSVGYAHRLLLFGVMMRVGGNCDYKRQSLRANYCPEGLSFVGRYGLISMCVKMVQIHQTRLVDSFILMCPILRHIKWCNTARYPLVLRSCSLKCWGVLQKAAGCAASAERKWCAMEKWRGL